MTDTTTPVQFVKDARVVIEDQALAAAGDAMGSSTSLIEYRSAGHCLVIGDADEALDYVDLLVPLKVTVVTVNTESSFEKKLTATGTAVYLCPDLRLSGYLGQFEASYPGHDGKDLQLGVNALTETGYFDVVLDLASQASITAILPPFGYYRITDELSRQRCLDELPELVGEFEKPKYFNHNAAICAHERSQVAGCSNCLDVCQAGAITSIGDSISVNPYLCQGCGHCATVCPSGAMTYAYPKPADAIEKSRDLLNARSGKRASILLLYSSSEESADDQEEGIDAAFEQSLPEHVLALAVEEVGAFGADYWCSMIASGVQRIILLDAGDDAAEASAPSNAPSNAQAAISHQIEVAQTILRGMGLGEDMIQLIRSSDDETLRVAFELDNAVMNQLDSVQPATYATHNDKRQTLRFAIDHLSATLTPIDAVVALPQGSPFGRLNIDQSACTLCLACVSTCPSGALLDGQNLPQLKFIESNCVQCGICASACPEDALQLEPQFMYDSMAARTAEILNEEEPFNCLTCHKPFATRKMIDNMTVKLAGHWMFEDETRLRRLKMCEDCRVKDMFAESAGGIEVHKET